MNAAKRFFMVAGAFALATLTFTLANPKTAHAFVATLVHVVNTPDSQPFAVRLDYAISQNRGAPSFTVPAGKTLVIDYKDPQALKYFITDRGKIVPRRISGNCARHQRKVQLAVNRARNIALLPFTVTHSG